MSTDLLLDLGALEDLDFPASCGHSRHSEESTWHGGDAEFVAVSLHDCAGHPDRPAPYFYPACRIWAEYVLFATANFEKVRCVKCGTTGLWPDMVRIVSSLS